MRFRRLLLSLIIPCLPAQAGAPANIKPARVPSAEDAQLCVESAARQYQVPVELLASLVLEEARQLPIGCGQVEFASAVMAAALRDSKGDKDAALSRIYKGPTGPEMQKVFKQYARQRAVQANRNSW